MVLLFIIAWPVSKLLDCLLGHEHSTFFRRAGKCFAIAWNRIIHQNGNSKCTLCLLTRPFVTRPFAESQSFVINGVRKSTRHEVSHFFSLYIIIFSCERPGACRPVARFVGGVYLNNQYQIILMLE